MTRRYAVPAAHVLSSPELSAAENLRIFGKCANPNGHGHDYAFLVTVGGPVDEPSGKIIEPEQLDAIFDREIRQVYSHRMLNEVAPFDVQVPTAENIARVAYEAMAPEIAAQGGARLVRVRVVESSNNTFEYGEPR